MKKSNGFTAFYVEALLMIAVFVAIILVLTGVFGRSVAESAGARRLTCAVTLAENTAEIFSVSESEADLLLRLDRAGNASMTEEGDVPTVQARYGADMAPSADGEYAVTVTWEQDGKLVSSHINVRYFVPGEEPVTVYSIETATILRGEVGK